MHMLMFLQLQNTLWAEMPELLLKFKLTIIPKLFQVTLPQNMGSGSENSLEVE